MPTSLETLLFLANLTEAEPIQGSRKRDCTKVSVWKISILDSLPRSTRDVVYSDQAIVRLRKPSRISLLMEAIAHFRYSSISFRQAIQTTSSYNKVSGSWAKCNQAVPNTGFTTSLLLTLSLSRHHRPDPVMSFVCPLNSSALSRALPISSKRRRDDV